MKNEYITRTKITMTKFLKNYMDYFEEKTFIRTKILANKINNMH